MIKDQKYYIYNMSSKDINFIMVKVKLSLFLTLSFRVAFSPNNFLPSKNRGRTSLLFSHLLHSTYLFFLLENGIYDENTEKSVIKFQKFASLKEDGLGKFFC